MVEVRLAVPRDRERAIETITAAFAHDPAWAFMHSHEYVRTAPLFAGALFDLRVVDGGAWITDDGASVSLCENPGWKSRDPERATAIWDRFRGAAGEEVWARIAAYDAAVEAVMPSGSFWYLGVLATRPERQRSGLARAVLAPLLAEADATGADICLETSRHENTAFYGRLGFVVDRRIEITGGPPTWWMRRPAVGSRG